MVNYFMIFAACILIFCLVAVYVLWREARAEQKLRDRWYMGAPNDRPW